MAASLQTAGGPTFGDGAFQPNDNVTIHSVSNLAEGLCAKVIAYDAAACLYVVRDSTGAIWGLRREKLRAQQMLELSSVHDEWTAVPDGVVVPGGVDVRMDLQTGEKHARKLKLNENATKG